jgi:diaminopimelate decarboxylase
MDHFYYRQHQLYAEALPVKKIAKAYGTPCYIYSRATLERHWHVFAQALSNHANMICYAVKANSNIGLLNLLARLGAGFDIVSGGELARVIRAQGDPKKVVFSGVAKTHTEIEQALHAGIYCFNVESAAELARINQVAEHLNLQAPIAYRINPNVDAQTHPHISTGLKENKFGIPIAEAEALYQQAAALPHIQIKGVACHIGSQLTEMKPFLSALEQLQQLIQRLQAQNIQIQHLDVGGGLGVRYQNETPPQPADYARHILQHLNIPNLTLIFEPGRCIVANAGILVSKVEYLKETPDHNFAIMDAGMNDLLRPALYSAWQNIIPVEIKPELAQKTYDIVGPICESADFLGKQRSLAITAGDLLAVRSSGAYGFTMSSNYNTRPRAAEILVSGEQAYCIRKREELTHLYVDESLLPEEAFACTG